MSGTRRAVIGLLILANALILALISRHPTAAPAVTQRAAGHQKNILLITVACLPPSLVGCYAPGPQGSSLTPHIDTLAREGVRYADVCAQTDFTTGSSLCLLYSRYYFEVMRPDQRALSMPEYFHRQGYRTAGFVSTIHHTESRFENAFETYRMPMLSKGEERFKAADITQWAVSWLESGSREQPWFLWTDYWDLHGPFAPGESVTQTLREVDRNIGRTIEALSRLNMRDDTLIVFASQHGLGTAERGVGAHGPYEAVISVPMIMWRPGLLEQGVTVKEPAMLVDIFPTVLAALKQPAVPCSGINLLGPRASDRVVYAQTDQLEAAVARQNGLKLIEYLKDFKVPHDLGGGKVSWTIVRPRGTKELYDVASDPGERHDLMQTRQRDAARLQGLLHAWQGDLANTNVNHGYSPELKQALQKYGYF